MINKRQKKQLKEKNFQEALDKYIDAYTAYYTITPDSPLYPEKTKYGYELNLTSLFIKNDNMIIDFKHTTDDMIFEEKPRYYYPVQIHVEVRNYDVSPENMVGYDRQETMERLVQYFLSPIYPGLTLDETKQIIEDSNDIEKQCASEIYDCDFWTPEEIRFRFAFYVHYPI
ncbi:MAG: hypothetical protein Q4C55_09005 [Eubacterium sp.]|nr:hypothetical protein [Eubacterium sp.]